MPSTAISKTCLLIINAVYQTNIYYGMPMLSDLRHSLKTELDQVQNMINEATFSDITLIQTIHSYALNQPEKKLIRPLIILLLAKSANYKGQAHIVLAAIIEMIHGATLLHDDVIDKADTRRNKASAHKQFGATQSILMGDFIYASAFQLIAKLNNANMTQILARATKEIVEGEILQLSFQGNPNIQLKEYFSIIRGKTALLFSTGAHCVEEITTQSGFRLSAHHFGMLYQITDDILDIDTDNTELNKSHGTDLKEGKMTLPVILAYKHATTRDKKTIEDILLQNQSWGNILPILERTKAIELCKPYLTHHMAMGASALAALPDSQHKKYLLNLLSYVPKRKC
jgi:octaprenyl-diphosphate synthase